jgi:hypothetical protein
MADKELARQEIRLAREQIRSQMRFPLWLTFLVGAALLVVGALQEQDLHSWLVWMSGSALIALSLGMWFAFDWARVGYGLLGLIGCAAFAVEITMHRQELDLATILELFQALFWGWIAIYAFLPSTRRLFARTRRESEVP